MWNCLKKNKLEEGEGPTENKVQEESVSYSWRKEQKFKEQKYQNDSKTIET